ncbi:expressed protein [Echinococcus multilocularis]|uniref:Expressed protein n=1 Tax=Echinococcus multilocularis TaxID=6211 RepID=A0A087VX46_ECHMU|nr:expressed protein [Echinococcus multilocularis]
MKFIELICCFEDFTAEYCYGLITLGNCVSNSPQDRTAREGLLTIGSQDRSSILSWCFYLDLCCFLFYLKINFIWYHIYGLFAANPLSVRWLPVFLEIGDRPP